MQARVCVFFSFFWGISLFLGIFLVAVDCINLVECVIVVGDENTARYVGKGSNGRGSQPVLLL